MLKVKFTKIQIVKTAFKSVKPFDSKISVNKRTDKQKKKQFALIFTYIYIITTVYVLYT